MRLHTSACRPAMSIFFILIVMFLSCDEDGGPKGDLQGDPPSIQLNEIAYLTTRVAMIKGNITFAGSGPITRYGLCYDTISSPTINGLHTSNGEWLGPFSDTLVNLIPAREYYVRAYAENEFGINYSNTMEFKTMGAAPSFFSVMVKENSNIPPTAIIRGRVQPNMVNTTAYFQYGLTTEYELGDTEKQIDIIETTTVEAQLDNLIAGKQYHFRLVAENSAGSIYSEDISFISEFQIGQEYDGGLIAYIDETGMHGIISRTTYASENNLFNWGPIPHSFLGATGVVIGSGKANTELILEVDQRSYASLIDWYSGGWHMPSKDEMNLVRNNIYLNGFGSFGGWNYATSSEVDMDSIWVQNFSTGEQFIGYKYHTSNYDFVSVGVKYF